MGICKSSLFKISPRKGRDFSFSRRGKNFPLTSQKEEISINRRGKSSTSTIRKEASPFLTYPQIKVIIWGSIEGGFAPSKWLSFRRL
jgi:hypothetical protein